MKISIFDVIGPVMVGPSSSHTAGAVKLARVARNIAGASIPVSEVSFGLHGSFAKTYRGHGTDKALVAGALGLNEDDARIANAFALAEEQGLRYRFYETDLLEIHENSVKITFTMQDGANLSVVGSSIGGGQILIREVDGFPTEFDAVLPTLLIKQKDTKGMIQQVSRVLAEHDINISTMKVSREARGETAYCIIETDHDITPKVVTAIRGIKHILSVQSVQVMEDEPTDV